MVLCLTVYVVLVSFVVLDDAMLQHQSNSDKTIATYVPSTVPENIKLSCAAAVARARRLEHDIHIYCGNGVDCTVLDCSAKL